MLLCKFRKDWPSHKLPLALPPKGLINFATPINRKQIGRQYQSLLDCSTGKIDITVICLLHEKGSSDSLAIRHLPEVCSLSGRVMLQPVSPPLQRGFRFLRFLLPAYSTVCLAVSPASGIRLADIRAYYVPSQLHSG